jgi:RNA polymerase sigma-70 factor (ECF subfamily)
VTKSAVCFCTLGDGTFMSWKEHVVGLQNIDSLYHYALILTRDPAEAQDLVHETYVRALRAMGRLQLDSKVRNWIFTILRNIWLNQSRSLRHASSVSIDEYGGIAKCIGESLTGPYDLCIDQGPHQQVRDAISQLPMEFQEIIFLREYENFSYREIAHVLNCPLGTVVSRLGRARSRLRTSLEQMFPSTGEEVTPSARQFTQ